MRHVVLINHSLGWLERLRQWLRRLRFLSAILGYDHLGSFGFGLNGFCVHRAYEAFGRNRFRLCRLRFGLLEVRSYGRNACLPKPLSQVDAFFGATLPSWPGVLLRTLAFGRAAIQTGRMYTPPRG